jgi:hypothetical protein
MKSIIQIKKECYINRLKYDTEVVINLHEHHIFFGDPWRRISEKRGLKVWLTYEYHEGTNGVHGKNGHALDIELKKIGQKAYMDYYNRTVEEFIKEFGRNYLEME